MPGKDVWVEMLKSWYGDDVEQATHTCIECLIRGKMLFERHGVIDQPTLLPEEMQTLEYPSLWRIGSEPLVYVMQTGMLGHEEMQSLLDFCDRCSLELEIDERAAFQKPGGSVGVTIWNRAVRQKHFRTDR